MATVSGPTVILVTGVNGSGKTTSIAKLARLFLAGGQAGGARGGRHVPCGGRRAALRCGPAGSAPRSSGVSPAAIRPALPIAPWRKALEGSFDVCIVDTAGRLQTQSNLMQELSKIRRVIAKQIPDAPHEVLLVIDATAGQNALSQAKGFKEAAGCTGIVLAKLDGSARGGVIVPVTEQFGLPVKFVGAGRIGRRSRGRSRPEEFRGGPCSKAPVRPRQLTGAVAKSAGVLHPAGKVCWCREECAALGDRRHCFAGPGTIRHRWDGGLGRRGLADTAINGSGGPACPSYIAPDVARATPRPGIHSNALGAIHHAFCEVHATSLGGQRPDGSQCSNHADEPVSSCHSADGSDLYSLNSPRTTAPRRVRRRSFRTCLRKMPTSCGPCRRRRPLKRLPPRTAVPNRYLETRRS